MDHPTAACAEPVPTLSGVVPTVERAASPDAVEDVVLTAHRPRGAQRGAPRARWELLPAAVGKEVVTMAPVHQRGPEASSPPAAGPFRVRDLSDIRALMGEGASNGDAAMLLRLLREQGRIRLGEDDAVIDLETADELRAWARRAQVAARRERSMLGEARWL